MDPIIPIPPIPTMERSSNSRNAVSTPDKPFDINETIEKLDN